MIVSLLMLSLWALFSWQAARLKWTRALIPLMPLYLLIDTVRQSTLLTRAESYLLERIPWKAFPEFELSFQGDALNYYLASLVLFVCFCISVYSLGYFKGAPRKLGRFFLYFYSFTMAMLGFIFSSNLLGLFVFWELTSVCSFLLIAFYFERSDARASALQAFLVTGIGALFMLAGFLFLGFQFNTFNLGALAQISSQLGGNFSQDLGVNVALALVFIGVFTKSAQFPFSFWLPNAMTAPSPASSYLHSATMVKAGVFLLLKIYPVFSSAMIWKPTLFVVGACTFTVAAFMAFFQKDLKAYLAYTTVAALGILVFLVGSDSVMALQAALLFIPAHAFYKAPLFLLVGNVELSLGSRQLEQVSGLWKKIPVTALCILMAALGMAGLPPFFSFVAKEWMLEFLLHDQPALLVFFIFCTVVFVWLAVLLAYHLLFAKRDSDADLPVKRDLPWALDAAPWAMVLMALVLTFTPGIFEFLGFGRATALLLPGAEIPAYKFWAGVHPSLFLSILVVTLGVLLYKFSVPHLKRFYAWGASNLKTGPKRFYDYKWKLVLNTSARFFSVLQNGRLPYYLMIILFSSVVLLMLPLLVQSQVFFPAHKISFADVELFEFFLVLAMLAGAVMALRSQSNLAALTALGIIGVGISFLFLINGAPDLALTQFLVESLVLILLVLTFRYLPKTPVRSEPFYKFFTGLLALSLGLIMAFLTYSAAQPEARAQIWDYFARHSYLTAHGKNVVNVILVDFRAFDTMGEIVVLTLAAVGIFTLLFWPTSKEVGMEKRGGQES